MAVPAPTPQRGVRPRRGRVEGSERELVRRAQRGDAEAFEGLFSLHWPRAYRAAWLVVHDAAAAEDIAQEAFIAALGALDRFDRRRPFGPWLSRIVVNRAIDHARSRRLHAVPTEGIAATAPPAAGRLVGRGRARAAPSCRSTSARSWSCATRSATRRARSRRRSSCRAAPSTRACHRRLGGRGGLLLVTAAGGGERHEDDEQHGRRPHGSDQTRFAVLRLERDGATCDEAVGGDDLVDDRLRHRVVGGDRHHGDVVAVAVLARGLAADRGLGDVDPVLAEAWCRRARPCRGGRSSGRARSGRRRAGG